MKIKYSRLIDLRNIAGIKTAEQLKAKGWKIASSGIDTVQFYKSGTGQIEQNRKEKMIKAEREYKKKNNRLQKIIRQCREGKISGTSAILRDAENGAIEAWEKYNRER